MQQILSRYIHNRKDYALLANGDYWEPTNTFSYSSQSRFIKWLDIPVQTFLKIWKAFYPLLL